MDNARFVFSLIILASLSGCPAEPPIAKTTRSDTPAEYQLPAKYREITLPHSMKGYVIYGWKEGRKNLFCLTTGTNWLKPKEEIISGEDIDINNGWVKIKIEGLDSLMALLSKMPKGEYVTWHKDSFFGHLLSEDQLNKLTLHCAKLGLKFH
ncbi:MAG: hypothetical protein K8S55_00235 [Phycisphaerae bacterium]|nr:hypothetical protein [Phycisphaerae bacterium]